MDNLTLYLYIQVYYLRVRCHHFWLIVETQKHIFSRTFRNSEGISCTVFVVHCIIYLGLCWYLFYVLFLSLI